MRYAFTHRGQPVATNHIPKSNNERYGFNQTTPFKIPNFRTGSPYFDDYADDSPYYVRYMRNYYPFKRGDYEF